MGHECLNGATCVDDHKRYLCVCRPGYIGKQRHSHLVVIILLQFIHIARAYQYLNYSIFFLYRLQVLVFPLQVLDARHTLGVITIPVNTVERVRIKIIELSATVRPDLQVNIATVVIFDYNLNVTVVVVFLKVCIQFFFNSRVWFASVNCNIRRS